MKTIIIKVKNIHCQNCINIIKSELMDLDGIKSVKGDLSQNTVTITYDGDNTIVTKIKNTLTEIGYPEVIN